MIGKELARACYSHTHNLSASTKQQTAHLVAIFCFTRECPDKNPRQKPASAQAWAWNPSRYKKTNPSTRHALDYSAACRIATMLEPVAQSMHYENQRRRRGESSWEGRPPRRESSLGSRTEGEKVGVGGQAPHVSVTGRMKHLSPSTWQPAHSVSVLLIAPPLRHAPLCSERLGGRRGAAAERGARMVEQGPSGWGAF